ncbi:glycosyltransferase [Nocardia wallacei]|uniref:glycosyltransferase n=1 Tax=Nocardia wallacei TaxID=480035 RepID=UPI00245697C4|nr:glycosyltransferase [Nocardia wallacei]
MRVVLSTYGSRGDVEPMVALAIRLRDLGVEVRLCAPPDFEERVAEVGVPMIPVGPSVRRMLAGGTQSTEELLDRAAELIAAQFDAVAAAAEGCDALVAAGQFPAAAGAHSVAEKLGIRYVYASFQQLTLPSPHRPPPYPGWRFPPETGNRELWDLDARNIDALFGPALNTQRAAAGLPPLHDIRDHTFTDRPWLATDPVLDPWQEPADLDVAQTGAWILPDARPLPAELAAFLDAGAPPVYVGFGSMPMAASDITQATVEAIRAQGRRVVVSHGWAEPAPTGAREDCLTIGDVNHQALFDRVAAVVHHGGAGTTTAAARAGTPQVVIPQLADQPYWARRVAELRIGAAFGPGSAPAPESLSAAFEIALAPETRTRAATVAESLRMGGTAVAAAMLVVKDEAPTDGGTWPILW